MEGVTSSWSVPRWMLVSLFLITWIHLTTGKCQHYGHACLGAHGKKRAGGTLTMESVPLSSRILHSLPDSSEGIMAAVDPGRHSVTRARDLIKRHLPPRFIFNMLKSRFKED
ncbi:uncharacterized protein LOC124199947 [Daphnia pulex]|uniref:uncharacterized protein LOC124199947 n=1 Tax=Daphnia pulex TaxID=6669 RepID=UPI001EDF46A8|nr:uncharacterized protein LOC124199947 [Daphnia pulex]